MAKYYQKGQREYFMVSPEKIIKVLNKEFVSFITIAYGERESLLRSLVFDEFYEKEITREEFEKEFEVASRLIVMES